MIFGVSLCPSVLLSVCRYHQYICLSLSASVCQYSVRGEPRETAIRRRHHACLYRYTTTAAHRVRWCVVSRTTCTPISTLTAPTLNTYPNTLTCLGPGGKGVCRGVCLCLSVCAHYSESIFLGLVLRRLFPLIPIRSNTQSRSCIDSSYEKTTGNDCLCRVILSRPWKRTNERFVCL
jgi:hypothetical protein